MSSADVFAETGRRLAASLPDEAREIAETLLRWADAAPDYVGPVWAGSVADLDRPGATPPAGTPIVYFMYAPADRLAYVGQTVQNLGRRHKYRGTWAAAWYADVVRWEARECRTPRDALDLELREVTARRPYGNAVIRDAAVTLRDYLEAVRALDLSTARPPAVG